MIFTFSALLTGTSSLVGNTYFYCFCSQEIKHLLALKNETSCLQPGNINSECYFNRKGGRKKGSKEKGKKRSKRQDPENFQKTCAEINMV